MLSMKAFACFSSFKFVSRLLLQAMMATNTCTTVSMVSQPAGGSPMFHHKSRRLLGVEGVTDKQNDVVFYGKSAVPERNIVFFGGDVQDFLENMESHRDNHHFKQWNLEETASLLGDHFANAHIWVVRPSRMHLKTFSVFSNFVESSDFGNPTHKDDYGSIQHINLLLQNAVKKLNQVPSSDKRSKALECDGVTNMNIVDKDSAPQNEESVYCDASPEGNHPKDTGPIGFYDIPVSIIGFSKGCVVLNQFLYELNAAKENPNLQNFVKQISSMYWLDGGHSGESNTWITDGEVLNGLVDTNISVHIHVTPYQISDVMRKWIGKEQKKFAEKLRKLGVTITEKVHFEDQERSLENHFNVLQEFTSHG